MTELQMNVILYSRDDGANVMLYIVLKIDFLNYI